MQAVNETRHEAPRRILLIDDDVDLAALLGEYLESEGFLVEAVSNGADGIARALEGDPDIIVLDIMMPGMSGIDVLRRLREVSDVPVLMLTARGDEIDRVLGLELGADDYVAKPCFPRELVARLRAILRRQVHPAHDASRAAPILRAGELEIQIPERRALWRGSALELTPTEFNILVLLVRSGTAVATKDELSLRGLGRPRQSYDRSIDVHVSNLRLKLEAGTAGAAGIETVRGVGYRLSCP
ncbi:transcriptional regulatory protein CpxR [Novosphingobium sp. MBES04]|nr:transcriptional regulatory protein CpxR [Novosphingobium sp. MBES04]